MNIRIKTFAVLKSYFQDEFEIQIKEGAKIIDIEEQLKKINPKANHIISHCLFALNDEMADKLTELQEGQLICILPPVSGG